MSAKRPRMSVFVRGRQRRADVRQVSALSFLQQQDYRDLLLRPRMSAKCPRGRGQMSAGRGRFAYIRGQIVPFPGRLASSAGRRGHPPDVPRRLQAADKNGHPRTFRGHRFSSEANNISYEAAKKKKTFRVAWPTRRP